MGAAQGGVEVEIERRVGLHAGLAAEYFALFQIGGRQGFFVDVILGVLPRLATALAGGAHALAAVERDLDAAAQGGIEQHFVAFHCAEKRLAVGKIESDLVRLGHDLRAVTGDRNRAPS
ncbi:hypothetical protein D3C76_1281590 [compost metagenome]